MNKVNYNLVPVEELENILRESDNKTRLKIAGSLSASYIQKVPGNSIIVSCCIRAVGESLIKLYAEDDKRIRAEHGVSASLFYDIEH